MNVLLVDIGNTRVKWATLRGGVLGPQRAAAHAGWGAAEFARRVLRGAQRSERILVASVAGAALERHFRRAARSTGGVRPEFVRAGRRLAGVTTRYHEPWRLGVDRLVAVIGARRLAAGRAACVIDIGTAMTIDLVDGAGRHPGGAIIPGPQLMVQSLLRETRGIRRRARGGAPGRSLFARATREAIEQGARYAVAGAIERAVAEARRQLGARPLVLVTGGAAERVRPLLRGPVRSVPDLVLQGLAAIAERRMGR